MNRASFTLRVAIAILWFLALSLAAFVAAPFFLRSPTLNWLYGRGLGYPLQKLFGLRVEVEGEDFMLRSMPCVIVGNHQSALDLVIYGTVFPRGAVAIGKKELLHIPFFGLFFWAAGNVLINRQHSQKAVAGLREATEAMKNRGVSMWLFPEGTRNRGQVPLLPFKRGAFHMAIAGGYPLVALAATPLRKYFLWDEKRVLPSTIKVKVLPPYDTKNLTADDAPALLERVHADMLRTIEELGRS